MDTKKILIVIAIVLALVVIIASFSLGNVAFDQGDDYMGGGLPTFDEEPALDLDDEEELDEELDFEEEEIEEEDDEEEDEEEVEEE